ncbi:Imm8 family immunity protein [Paenibacillus aestuarii]|uniref:Imm8 family immunity protein n=1 Tax=Paenibacillus aestuarii TaxID=516965 RepID=A0ABW0KHG8_9BACL|nr:Imm8 family immunity protein [Paenibacillus aestuarii]
MIVPVLKRILLRGEPEKYDDFVLPASADIGSDNVEGVDYFYFRIMTPKKLLSILEQDKVVDGRATFIVNEFDLSLVEIEINKILQDCIRPTWDEVAKAINRHLNWEYDHIQYETLEEAKERLNKDK